MRWLSFVRDSEVTFGYVTTDGEGVVDAGARTEYAGLREAIEADALTAIVASCGDAADVPLDGLHYAPTITNPRKIMCVGLN
jgi:hypothetical protein